MLGYYRFSAYDLSEHNLRKDKTYTKGINEYSDMTEEEFRNHFMLHNNEE